jgi:hypothetical protein
MMPVTKLIATLCQKTLNDNRNSFEQDPDAEKMIQSIIRNEPFDPVFWISDRRVRITNFTVEQDVLTLTLLPEKT